MIRTAAISYMDEKVELEAFAAFPDEERRPAVILCHAWKGRDDFICEKARKIAELGYVGFALDMYGKGVLGKTREENAALKKPFLENRALLQRRLLKALEAASSLPYVDKTRIAALGYGFGGLCALDFARSGADLKGAICTYGHFEPSGLPAKPVLAKILVLHGADDPIVKTTELLEFGKEMSDAKADWRAQIFGNTLHAFVNPAVNSPELGMAYSPVSAQRAWTAAQDFLREVF